MKEEDSLVSTDKELRVYILLPVHNRHDITVTFAECLKKQTYKNLRLILIDDGSEDGTAEAVKEIFNDVTVIRGEGSWWWAGSLQQGHNWIKKNKKSNDDVVLIMNDDTSFKDDFISIGLNILADNPTALLTATGYNLKTENPQDSGGYNMNWADSNFIETYDNAKINCTSTRGLMVRVSDFIDINGFYPRLIPHYLSDLEFTMRAQKKGKKLILHPDFRIGIDFETTGHRKLGNETFVEYVKKIFSKRAAMNPLHWSNFILLHSPWKYKYSNLYRTWAALYYEGVWGRLMRPYLSDVLDRLRPYLSDVLDRLRPYNFRGKKFLLSVIMAAAYVGVVAESVGVDYYVLRTDNRIGKAQPGQFGIQKKDAEFLTHFAGQLTDGGPENDVEFKIELRKNILNGFKKDGHRLSEMHQFGSERERLITYIMLRVNGSAPIYNSAITYNSADTHNNLWDMLNGTNTNCGPATTRLLMVLDAFAIRARSITWFSPSLGGHVFVDAYDEVEKKAYLLDSLYNIWSKFDNVNEGYLDVLAKMRPEERKRYLKNNLNEFPYYKVKVIGMPQGGNAFREEEYLKIKDNFHVALTYEFPYAIEHWKKVYPNSGIPENLSSLAKRGGYLAAIKQFSPEFPLQRDSLLKMAGLPESQLDYSVMNPRLEAK
jgi:GT2 family glycosyltransferase